MSGYQEELTALRQYRDGKVPFSSATFRQAKMSNLAERPKELLSSSKRRNSIRPIDRAAVPFAPLIDSNAEEEEEEKEKEENNSRPGSSSAVFSSIDEDSFPATVPASPAGNTDTDTGDSNSRGDTGDNNIRGEGGDRVVPAVSVPVFVPPAVPVSVSVPVSSAEQHDRLAATVRVLMDTLEEQGALRVQLEDSLIAQSLTQRGRERHTQTQRHRERDIDTHTETQEQIQAHAHAREGGEEEVQIRLRGTLLELEKTVQQVSRRGSKRIIGVFMSHGL
jgi:hypothetical protein